MQKKQGKSSGKQGPQRNQREQRPSQQRGGQQGKRDARTSSGSRSQGGRPSADRGTRPSMDRGPRAQAQTQMSRPAGNYIEGRRAAAEAVRTGFPVKRAIVARGLENDREMLKLTGDLSRAGITLDYVSRTQLDAISVHGAHQGIALETAPFPYADLADVIQASGTGPALVVVLDHVTDAGNFGAIVRSAEVVGAAGVVIANKRAAEVTVTTYKTSAGAVMHLPIAQVPNLARALDDLKAAGFWVGGATEHAEDICWDSPMDGRLALVMGSEGDGISRLILEKCDFLTKLPQRGQTESLNVAQAATTLCFEWMRRTWTSLDTAEGGEA